MKPLVVHERAIVLHASCSDTCAWLSAGRRAAVTITDPPYTEHVHGNIRSVNAHGKLKVTQIKPGFDSLTAESTVDVTYQLLSATERWVLAFCAMEQFDWYQNAAQGTWKSGGSYVRSGIWRKQNSAPQISGDRPANACDGIAVMHPRRPDQERLRWNGHGKHAFWRVDGEYRVVCDGCFDLPDATALLEPRCACGGNWQGVFLPPDDLSVEHSRERAQKVHPCQKPVALLTELIGLFTEPGDWILDPFCGSGSLGVAALRAGRNVILSDDLIDNTGEKPRDYWAQYAANVVRKELG